MSQGTMWQFVVEDESELSGDSLREILTAILEVLGPMIIRVGDIEGAGKGITRLRTAESREQVLTSREVINIADEVVQIDWGDFFFFDSQRAAKTLPLEEKYSVAALRARLLLRAVDDSYYYLYGREERLLTHLRRIYPAGKLKRGDLDDFDFPF